MSLLCLAFWNITLLALSRCSCTAVVTDTLHHPVVFFICLCLYVPSKLDALPGPNLECFPAWIPGFYLSVRGFLFAFPGQQDAPDFRAMHPIANNEHPSSHKADTPHERGQSCNLTPCSPALCRIKPLQAEPTQSSQSARPALASRVSPGRRQDVA